MTTYDELLEGTLYLGHAHGDEGDHDDDDLLVRGIDLGGLPFLASIGEAVPDLGAAFANVGRGGTVPVQVTSDAFAFGVTVADTVGGIASDVLDVFRTITELALGTWSQFLGAAEGSSIEVQVNVGGTDAVASAGPGTVRVDRFVDANGSGVIDEGDQVIAIAGSLLEMQTGVDPNGAGADIVVNVNEELLADGRFFFDTTLTQDVPDGQFDFYSVVLHELAHGLGFLGFADEPGPGNLPFFDFGTEDDSLLLETGFLYDFLTETVDGQPLFTGENVTRIYGEAAPLEYLTGNPGSDLSHWQARTGPDGIATDLQLALMNPFVIPGDRVEIGDIELALLADIGHEIVAQTGQLLNEFDPVPEGAAPIVAPFDGAAFVDGQLVFTIDIDPGTLFATIASGVAVAVEGTDGALLTDRAIFQPGQTSAEVAFDAAALVAGGLTNRRGTTLDETFTVTLYNPSQAVLPNGQQQAAFLIDVSGLYGTDRADYLRGTSGDDDVFGGAGDDRIVAGNGDDLLDGGEGADRLYAGNGADRVEAGTGDDRVLAGNGSDTVLGGAGDDVLSGQDGDDLVRGEDGDDVIRLGSGNDSAAGGDGDDDVRGEDGADLLIAGGGDDTLSGGGGDDVLIAEAGRDLLLGGAGADLFDVTGAEAAVIADLDFGEGDALFFGGADVDSAAALEAFLAGVGVTAFEDGGDLVIGFGSGQTVTLEDFGSGMA